MSWKREVFESIKGHNLEDMYTNVYLQANDCSKEELRELEEAGYECFDFDDEEPYYCITKEFALEHGFWVWDAAEEEFDEDLFEQDLSIFFNPSDNYLVCGAQRWNGAKGYALKHSYKDIFSRGYDCSFYLENVSRGGKTLLFTESSHDVPMGAMSCAIALTDREVENVSQWLNFGNFPALEEFVEQRAAFVK